MRRAAVIVAGGSSLRFGEDKLEKVLFGKTVLQHSVDLFAGIVQEIVVVGKRVEGTTFAEGGATRSQSVLNGLRAVSKQCQLVAVHDAARPFVSAQLAKKLFEECQQHGSAVPKLQVTDTLWSNVAPQNRDMFFTVQTPQVFPLQKLLEAFERFPQQFTDESTLFFHAYGNVHFVDGETSNKKITLPQDIPQFSIGTGFDVHAFGEGNAVILGGVSIPFHSKLVGHSDADVLAHAICDAVLSASANRDIGTQFPDTDDKYLGANSLHLLSQCVALAAKNGFVVQNVSAVVICQQPKLAPHLPLMEENIAKVLGVPSNCVNLSATTTEHLGALGNGDGIAATATALLCKRF